MTNRAKINDILGVIAFRAELVKLSNRDVPNTGGLELDIFDIQRRLEDLIKIIDNWEL